MKSTDSPTNDSILVDPDEEVDGGGKRMLSIPIVEDNTEYIEVMRQVDAGELTIEPADE